MWVLNGLMWVRSVDCFRSLAGLASFFSFKDVIGLCKTPRLQQALWGPVLDEAPYSAEFSKI